MWHRFRELVPPPWPRSFVDPVGLVLGRSTWIQSTDLFRFSVRFLWRRYWWVLILLSFIRASAKRGGTHAHLIDVQNRCAFRYSRFGICDIERKASPPAVFAVPYRAYPYRW